MKLFVFLIEDKIKFTPGFNPIYQAAQGINNASVSRETDDSICYNSPSL